MLRMLVRFLVCISFFITFACSAESVNQTSILQQDVHHATAIKRIVDRLSQSHYVSFTLNDRFSKKIFDQYVEQLDPNKTLFLETDIAQFNDKKTKLDDELKSANLDTAYALFRLLQARHKEQSEYFILLLDEPMSLNGNDIIQLERKLLPRPKTETEQRILWYSLVKNDVINLTLAGKKWSEIQKILKNRYLVDQRQFALSNSEDVFNLFINSFMAVLDPHTNYLSPIDTANFASMMSLSLEGIGATLVSNDGYVEIVSLVANGPAEKSKQLSVGDRIVAVGENDKKPMVDIIGWRLDDAIALIKGPKNSKVRLKVLPKNNESIKIITLTRERIKFEDSKAKTEIRTVNNQKVAILTIPSFYIGVSDDTETLLRKLDKQEVSGLVVDLRMNPGGSLLEAVYLSDLFLSQIGSPVVQVKSSDGRVKAYNRNNIGDSEFDLGSLLFGQNRQKYFFNKPMVVLVNRLSVSASEIFAAAMQDYGRAMIVGETTFGKGTVQDSVSITRVYDDLLHPNWEPFGSIRYTTQKFYRVSGGGTQLEGVTPDLIMSSFNQGLSEVGEKFENNALIWDKIKSVKYEKFYDFKLILPQLTARHEQRLKDSADYQFIQKYIEHYQLTKMDRRTLSLNLAQRKKEAGSDEKMVLDYVNYQLTKSGKKTISSLHDLAKSYQLPDTYADEAILIVLDLVELQH